MFLHYLTVPTCFSQKKYYSGIFLGKLDQLTELENNAGDFPALQLR